MRFPLLCLVFLLLASCNTTATENYTLEPPDTPAGRQCTMQCQEAESYCGQSCALDNRACYGKLQEQAVVDYDKYVRDQFARHEPVELQAHDFERTGNCDADKKNCDGKCASRYRSCFQDCGGEVARTTTCQFMCF